ncbi:MAG: methyl-accepting chemotaxis protein [Lachnospiraceae bacterium]|nr:methyl-accepting chemotaxis protein [Lachnospiraceae bacterium]
MSKNKKSDITFFNSVKPRLIGVMMLICIVPLLVSLTISYRSSMNQAIKDAQIKASLQAEVVQNEFLAIFIQNVRMMESISHSKQVKEILLDPQPGEIEAVQKYLITLNDHLGDGNDIIVEDATGQQIVRTSGNLVNVGDRDFFKEAMTGKEVISDVLISRATGLKVVILAIPIKDKEDNEVIGVVQKSYDLSFLHEFLAGTADASEGEASFIVDKKGDLIAHSGYELSPEDEAPNFSNSKFMTEGKDSGMFIGNHDNQKQIMGYKKDSQTGWTVVTSFDFDITISSARNSAISTVIIGVVMLIIAIFISFSMANSFTNPLHELNECMSQLAVGVFSPIAKYTSRKDEFGQIISNTNSVIDKLSGIIDNIKDSTSEVNNSAEDVAETANQISQTSESVASAVQEIASGATQQADEIQSVSENVEKISEANGQVQQNTSELSALATDMQDASKISSDNLGSLQKSSEKMSDSITQISEKVGATGAAVDNINSKVEEIASIATQTNLLSLNASIEAARAGEAGRGFAVVAEEISQLADNSKNLASAIRAEMDVLLSESRSAVEMADAVRKENEQQQDIITSTVQSVKDMIEDIASTADRVKTIEKAVDGCMSANDVVAEAMTNLSAVSEENAASSQTTGAAVEELSATVTTLASSADSLKGIAEKLSEDMSFFK